MSIYEGPRASVRRSSGLLALASTWGLGCASSPAAPRGWVDPGSGDANRGAVLGRQLCTSCHGVRGDGRGEAAAGLDPPPRDFVKGVYRYRSTPSGSLPTDADLARSIRVGLPGTAMPGFGAVLDDRQTRDLVAWVKRFSARFAEEEVEPPIHVPAPPPITPATRERGRQLYEELQCGKCHGPDGSGRGWAAQDDLRDTEGRVVPPRDFTSGIYRSGRNQRDLYRTFVTGLDGSPMPAYEGTLTPDDVYSLVHHLLGLERDRGFWHWLTHPPRWFEPGEWTVTREEGR